MKVCLICNLVPSQEFNILIFLNCIQWWTVNFTVHRHFCSWWLSIVISIIFLFTKEKNLSIILFFDYILELVWRCEMFYFSS